MRVRTPCPQSKCQVAATPPVLRSRHQIICASYSRHETAKRSSPTYRRRPNTRGVSGYGADRRERFLRRDGLNGYDGRVGRDGIRKAGRLTAPCTRSRFGVVGPDDTTGCGHAGLNSGPQIGDPFTPVASSRGEAIRSDAIQPGAAPMLVWPIDLRRMMIPFVVW
jgi:hypothetical protein